MADSIINIAFTANISALREAMDAAGALVGRTMADIRTSATTLPPAMAAAASEAGSSLASFSPQIQAASTRLLDLKAASAQVAGSIKETERIVIDAGGATEVGASIIHNYSKELAAQKIIQDELNAAIEEYKRLVNEAYAAQIRLASAPRIGPAAVITGTAPAAAATGASAIEAGAAGAVAGAAATGAGEGAAGAEAGVLGVEALTAAKEAETAAMERAGVATGADEAIESRLAAAEAESTAAARQLAITQESKAAAFTAASQAAGAGIQPLVTTTEAETALATAENVRTEALLNQLGIQIEAAALQGVKTEATLQGTVADISAAEAAGVVATSEDRLTASFLTNLVAKNAEIAATERGMAVLKESAAAGANRAAVMASLAGVTQRTAAQEATLEAAEKRLTTAQAELTTMQREVNAAKNASISSSTSQAAVEEKLASVSGTVVRAQSEVASAYVRNAIAQSELRTAQELAIATEGKDIGVMSQLSAAQIRASVTAAELAAAEKALAVATDEASGAFSLFRARLIAGENGMRAFITTSLTSIPLMIGALVAGFAVHAVNAIKETELELANLSTMIDISVSQLAALGAAAEGAGAKSDDLTQVFRRLDRTISDAMSGGKQAQLTLKELGIDITSLETSANPTLLALGQLEDYLHANVGSAEIMRAAMRALGTDSVATAAFLSQGSQKVREASEQYASYGKAAEKAVPETKQLAAEEEKLGKEWDQVKLALIPVLTGLLLFAEDVAHAVAYLNPLHDALRLGADLWNMFAIATGRATAADAEFMAQAMKKTFAPPAPPPIVTHKEEKPTKEAFVSEMPEFREELAEQKAVFEGSRSDMLRMEVMFWDQIIETGRAKGKDLIAAKRELFKAELDLRRENNAEILGEDNALAALAKQGSVERVALEQKVVNDVRTLYGENSREYARAQEQLMLAKKSQVEEEIRLNLEATNRSVALFKEGSVEKVRAYTDELSALALYLEAADTRAQTGSESQKIIARTEADFIIEQIRRITVERLRAVEANKAEIAGGEAKDAEKAITREIELIKEDEKERMTQFSTAKAQVDELASHEMISARTKIIMLDAIQEAEFRTQQAALQRERSELEAAATILRGLQGQEDKYQSILDKIRAIDAQIVESTNKRNAQIVLSNQKLVDQSITVFNKLFDTMEQGFNRAIQGMVTGQMTFSQGMLRMWGSVVVAAREALLKMALDWVKHEAQKLLVSETFQKVLELLHLKGTLTQQTSEQKQTIAHQQGIMQREMQDVMYQTNVQLQQVQAVTKFQENEMQETLAHQTAIQSRNLADVEAGIQSAIQAKLNALAIVSSEAGIAGAGGFASVMVAVPFPENVAMAPEVAAAASAATMAQLAVASAAGGAEIPHDMLTMVHKNEMILPANISGGLKTMISESSTSSTSRGGDMHMHYSPSVQAMDARGVKQVLEEHASVIEKIFQKGMRRGKFSYGQI